MACVLLNLPRVAGGSGLRLFMCFCALQRLGLELCVIDLASIVRKGLFLVSCSRLPTIASRHASTLVVIFSFAAASSLSCFPAAFRASSVERANDLQRYSLTSCDRNMFRASPRESSRPRVRSTGAPPTSTRKLAAPQGDFCAHDQDPVEVPAGKHPSFHSRVHMRHV